MMFYHTASLNVFHHGGLQFEMIENAGTWELKLKTQSNEALCSKYLRRMFQVALFSDRW